MKNLDTVVLETFAVTIDSILESLLAIPKGRDNEILELINVKQGLNLNEDII